MSQTLEAVYDGSVLHPETVLDVAPNTRVRITVESLPVPSTTRKSFLDTSTNTFMTSLIQPGDEVFLDTSYAIALSAPTDLHHERALQLASDLERANAKLITTREVLLEIGNALSRQRYRSAAVRLLQAMEEDESIEIIPATDSLYDEALNCF